MSSRVLDAALAYARRGLAVFPTNGKVPLTPHGFHDATRDEERIRAWWQDWPDAGIGLPTGKANGIVVVDVDDGEALEAFEREYGRLPPTFEVLTPRGGRHLYYRHPGNGTAVQNASGLRGFVGLDIRGDGGYVVAWPTPGYVKEISGDALSDLPACLLPDPGEAHHNGNAPKGAELIPEGMRNATLASLAGTMRRRGMTEAAIEAALLEENRDRCMPPLPEREVRQIAASIGRYAPDAARIHSAAPTVGVAAERKRGPDLVFRTARELASQTPTSPPYLVHGYITRGSITELVGKVKASGKTTLLLAMCRAVIRGEPFAGLATRQTKVVYLTEQPDASFRTALARARLDESDDFAVLSWHETIGRSWPQIVERAREECHARGAGLLVVDTLSQWVGIRGEGENAAGEALEAIRPLQEAVGIDGLAVPVVRHARKGGGEVGDDGRGSSAFAGAVDVVLSLRRPEGNADPQVRLLHGLSRFDETPESLALRLTSEGYTAIGNEAAFAIEAAKRQVLEVAPRSVDRAVTGDELLDAAKVRRTSGQEAIAALLDLGALSRIGEGKRGSPYRYWAPEVVTKTLSAGTAHIGRRNESGSEAMAVPDRERQSADAMLEAAVDAFGASS